VAGGPARRTPAGGGGIALPDALRGTVRPGGGGIGLPDALRGGRGGRVADGAEPIGGPWRGWVVGRAGADAAAAAAAASRSIDGAIGRGAAAGRSTGGVLEVTVVPRCDETILDAGDGRGGAVAVASGAGVLVTGALCTGVGGGGVTAGFSAAEREEVGSGGETARRSPSESALRRTRSACASSIDEEWLFTPMPRDKERSRASLLVSPSSLASS
jgi:hypothetical protein